MITEHSRNPKRSYRSFSETFQFQDRLQNLPKEKTKNHREIFWFEKY